MENPRHCAVKAEMSHDVAGQGYGPRGTLFGQNSRICWCQREVVGVNSAQNNPEDNKSAFSVKTEALQIETQACHM